MCAVQVHTHHAPNQQLGEVPDQGMGEQKVIVSAFKNYLKIFFPLLENGEGLKKLLISATDNQATIGPATAP